MIARNFTATMETQDKVSEKHRLPMNKLVLVRMVLNFQIIMHVRAFPNPVNTAIRACKKVMKILYEDHGEVEPPPDDVTSVTFDTSGMDVCCQEAFLSPLKTLSVAVSKVLDENEYSISTWYVLTFGLLSKSINQS